LHTKILLNFVYNQKRKSLRHIESYTPTEELPKLYPSRVSIIMPKKKDLQKICQKMLIPLRHHKFYSNLIVKQDGDGDDYLT